MNKVNLLIIALLMAFLLYSCSKRNHPAGTATTSTGKKADTQQVKKSTPSVQTKEVVPVPGVLIVNDKFAKITPDGRYYIDLRGHRYWRNNRDGKYYLFNKSMYSDDAFKKLK